MSHGLGSRLDSFCVKIFFNSAMFCFLTVLIYILQKNRGLSADEKQNIAG